MKNKKAICIFGGVEPNKKYSPLSTAIAEYLLQNNVTLVYGGSSFGLLGDIMQKMIAQNGEVIGVIPPYLLEKEQPPSNLTQLVTVKNSSERLDTMLRLSVGFLTIPGGIGTLEEFARVFADKAVYLHNKPIVLLNIDGYYEHLVKLFDRMLEEGLLTKWRYEQVKITSDYIEAINFCLNE